jgi:8-oxo-dGTP pyrophosphatase MutT (NUDIX family)
MLSHIQNLILQKFITKTSLKYSEAHPEGVTKDLFNYHLKFLIDKKYLKKIEEEYVLTDYGKKYVQKMDVLGNWKEYFRFSVVSLVEKEENGKRLILMQERNRHPYKGDIYPSVSGKVLLGEKLLDAAERKLKEETGLICKNFSFLGTFRKMRYDHNKHLIEDTLYHYCFGNELDGECVEENEFGRNFWTNYQEAKELQKKNMTYTEKSNDIMERLEQKNFEQFYWEEEVYLDKF